jgi:hypothetical protein
LVERRLAERRPARSVERRLARSVERRPVRLAERPPVRLVERPPVAEPGHPSLPFLRTDMLREWLESSLARLNFEPHPLKERALAGYFRISHTEPLIEIALISAQGYAEYNYWKTAQREESGHADLYLMDLVDTFGREILGDIARYEPCPDTVSLLKWAADWNINSALYRTYLEYALCRQPPEGMEIMREVLPRTLAVHLEADPGHAAAGLEFLARFNILPAAVECIERALLAESRWFGLANGRAS